MAEGGLRFECTRCGQCCTNRGEYAYVYLNDDETAAIARYLALPRGVFRRRYTFIDEDGWRQLSFVTECCVFLELTTNACRIYPARPTQCRTFPFWRDMVENGEWTQEARSLCEGVGNGHLYSSQEIEVRMVEMERSDES